MNYRLFHLVSNDPPLSGVAHTLILTSNIKFDNPFRVRDQENEQNNSGMDPTMRHGGLRSAFRVRHRTATCCHRTERWAGDAGHLKPTRIAGSGVAGQHD